MSSVDQDGWPSASADKASAASSGGGGWPEPAPLPEGGGEWPASSPQPSEAVSADGWSSATSDQSADTEVRSEELSDPPQPPAAPDASTGPGPKAQTNRLVWIVAAVIVVGIPIGVGIFAFKMVPTSGAPPTAVASVGASAAGPETEVVEARKPDPTWTRPAWADGVDEMVAFELPAGADVRLANGRLRPTLGISCVAGRTSIHIITGGSAPIDPVTSAHIVKLAFDGVPTSEEQWVASENQRALMAPEPLELAARIASARRLDLSFTHYMSGSEVVEFDLRGADEIVASMAEPCGWTDD